MDISDEELAKHIAKLLSRPGFTLSTVDDLVRRLESELGCDLSNKSTFIGEEASRAVASAYPIYPVDYFVLNPQSHSRDGEIKGSERPERNRIVNPDQQIVVEAEAEADSQDAARSVPAKRKGRAGGLHKMCGVTPQLQVIVGQQASPRTEIVKQVWAYIRKNNLQDPSDRRRIICDDALSAVMDTNCTDMFQMNKLLSKHIIQLEPPTEQEEESNQAKKLKVGSVDDQSPTGNGEPGPQKWIMSEALARFCGTGEREVLKSEVLERIWEYTVVNKLEDPVRKNVILCDAKLHQLFRCESIHTRDLPGMIDNHLFKPF